ncbi:MAG: transglutaminase TgpA family protein [Woeseiaceae bacterium]
MSKRTGTDGSLLASLPWTLAALAFAVLPHLQFLPIWATATFIACSAWRWQVERKRWRLPPAWIRIVLAFSCFVGVWLSYGESISGVGPGSALLAVMAALKLLETKQRRDQFVLLFISIFLIMSSLLREQYMWSLPFLIAGVLFTMTAWLHMSVYRQATIGGSLASAARLMAYAAPLMIAMWVFFPRIATPFWAVPIDTSSATSGLSDRMSPGDISSLSLSNAVAFRVNFNGTPPLPHQRYWRGLVLYNYNGRTWTGGGPSIDPLARSEVEYEGDPISYQITMEPTRQHWVFALDVPFEWDLDRTFMASQQQLARMQPLDQRTTYNAVSYIDYRLGRQLSSFRRISYTRLPEAGNERSIALAREMRAEAGSDEVFINQVLQKFNREEFYYTLEPPALGESPVDGFLFETKRGFCEHYASAFAVLMRAAGIPSRVVLGYQGGEINPLGQYMIVRQADAHAWNEVWLPGRGWYRVDPTAAVAPERIDAGRSGAMFDGIGADWGLSAPSEFLYQMTLTWDALNAKWNEWILAYGPDNQGQFMEWLGMEDPDWQKMMLTLVVILVILIGIISVMLIIRYRPPPKDHAARLYRKFTSATGVDPVMGETPLSYSRRLGEERTAMRESVQEITDLYLRARYGPPGLVQIPVLQAAVSEFSRNN